MRYYYSIANFLAGIGTEIYDNYFSSCDKTYQQLLGEMLGWSQGHTVEVQAMFNNNVLPQHFVNQWGNNLTRTIVEQFNHQYIKYENGNIKGWNGDDAAAIIQHTSLWNFMIEWNNVATIVAGVSDVIYQLIDDATSMLELEIMLLVIVGVGAGLVGVGAPINEGVVKGSIAMCIATSLIVINAFLDPFLGVEKINLMYQVGFDFSKLDRYDIAILVNKYGIEILKPLKEVGADFSKLNLSGIAILVNKYGIEILKPLKEVGADFSKLNLSGIAISVNKYGIEILKPLKEVGADFSKLNLSGIAISVNKYGIESIKPLKEVGADFSKFPSWQIGDLVKELGIESIKPLKEVGADFSKFPSWQIGDLVKELGIEIIEFYKIIDNISHYIIEGHIDDSEVEQDTISAIDEEVEINNLEGIVTEFNTSSWSEDL